MKSPTAEISILGQRITLKTSAEQDPETVREALALVADGIRNVEARAKKNVAPHQVALLALLELAERYVEAKRKTEDFKLRMAEKSGRLIRLLEAEMKKGAVRASTEAASDPALPNVVRELELPGN